MHLIYARDLQPTPKLTTFIDFMLERFGQRKKTGICLPVADVAARSPRHRASFFSCCHSYFPRARKFISLSISPRSGSVC
jgi:hypothetical protein